MLLFGPPGCGKTEMARAVSGILSPYRPLTIVAGPEVMQKFVGSSEELVRKIFDDPPDVVEGGNDGDLHVVVFDEFDSIGRKRGGKDGSDQGEAGMARDSVVNQLLAKIDGVTPLPVPTLVIALTNRRELLDPALLRPGRFEVQIEMKMPSSAKEREEIFRVHTKTMQESGRLEKYDSMIENLASMTGGMSGADIAGVCRSAAARALERAVE